MSEQLSEFVRQIHDAHRPIALVVTGGGSGAISALLEQPGASRTVLEATVPYSPAALATYLGATPEQFCSPRTARAMAMAAYQRALRYAPSEVEKSSLAGVACTASLVSDRPKHGEHRVHVALQTSAETWCWSLTLLKGARDRSGEEDVATRLILDAIGRHAGLDRLADSHLLEGESVEHLKANSPESWQRLLDGSLMAIPATTSAEKSKPKAIIAGAFNPLHVAHRKMADIAKQKVGGEAAFEISVINVDKPPLDFIEMRTRAEQFADAPLWFTRAPTFVEKAANFPGAIFVVGADTIRRIAEPRYYGDNVAARDHALETIASHGCRFLVFARRNEDSIETLNSLTLPDRLRKICDEVAADEFLFDVSSTELRRAARGKI